MVTILPYSCAIITRNAARMQAMGPFRLMPRILSQNSGVVSTNFIGLSQPAQFTRTCTPPQRAATSSTMRSTAATSVMSSGHAAAVPPAFSMADTVSRAASALRSTTATRAPSRAHVSAIARPMPLAPPVTMAALFFSLT